MSCENNNEAKVKWVYGNTHTVAITLEELVDIETGETAPFDIQEGDVVSVNIRGTFKTESYEPTIDGNTLTFKVGRELAVGDYVIEVGVVRGEDEYVSRKRWELAVVRYDDEANIPDDAEFSVEDLELIANMYIKGDMFTYDDMTEEQKVDLASRVGADFSIDADGYLCYGTEDVVSGVKRGIFSNAFAAGRISDNKLLMYCPNADDNQVCIFDANGIYRSNISPMPIENFATMMISEVSATHGIELDGWERNVTTLSIGDAIPDWGNFIDSNL